tara:strand:- start:168 stop:632 length:465 start_codon:yes stop_codon:yes gene_type:complete
MEVTIDVNTINVKKFLQKLSKEQRRAVQKSLNRVSNMAIFMITKRTQSGKLPDGGQMRAYAPATVKSRKKRGRQTGFVDLTDTGKMFRSLDYKKKGLRNTLFFSNMERNKIASYHDMFGAGKGKVVRPFFSIGRKEEEKIQKEFTSTYFKEMKI